MDVQQLTATVQQVQHKLQHDMAEIGQVLERMRGRRQAALPWRPGSQDMVSPPLLTAFFNPGLTPAFTPPNNPPHTPSSTLPSPRPRTLPAPFPYPCLCMHSSNTDHALRYNPVLDSRLPCAAK